jgi:alanine racemase
LFSHVTAVTDLAAVRHNVRCLAAQAADHDLVGVVKANAYGHGAAEVARVLLAEGVPRLAVATLAEGVALRAEGILAPVHVFGVPLPGALPAYVHHDLAATVAAEATAREAVETARLTGPLRVHVKVDTGMHRLGLRPDEAPAVVRRLGATPGVVVEGLWTHFATADGADVGFVAEQTARFDAVLAALGDDTPPLVHVANGPAAVRGLGLDLPHLPPGRRRLARLGGVLYGLASDAALGAHLEGLRPAMRLVSRVVHLQDVAPGESVSYARTWTASHRTRIATISCGYADGLPRALSNRGRVGVGGRLVPIVGTVCMDMLMVDLGPPDGPASHVRLGDEVVLFGPGGPTAEAAAAAAGTISYALTCGLTARVARAVTDEAP